MFSSCRNLHKISLSVLDKPTIILARLLLHLVKGRKSSARLLVIVEAELCARLVKFEVGGTYIPTEKVLLHDAQV